MALPSTGGIPVGRPASQQRPAPSGYGPKILVSGTRQLELKDISLKLDRPLRGDGEPVAKLNFRFVILALREGDEAKPAKVEAAKAKGHGQSKWDAVTIKITRAGTDYAGEATKESNLHRLLRNLINGGRPLSDEQIQGFYTPDGAGLDPQKLMALVGKQINAVFELRGEGDRAYDKIIAYSPVDADDYLPGYTAPERPVDPRAAELDDPSVVCSVTGEVLTGFEQGIGEKKGEWLSNAEWARIQQKKLGTAARFTFDEYPGKVYAPPFGRGFYRRAVTQAEEKAKNAAGGSPGF